MNKVAIVYYSATGNTEMMANAVADGVRNAGGSADVIDCTKKIRVIIRLKMRLKKFVPIHGHFIFVRIDHQCLRLLVESLHTFKQCMRCQLIVMVCKCNKIPGRCFYGTICILGDLQCTVVGDHFDPFIFGRNFFQDSCDRRIIPAAARDFRSSAIGEFSPLPSERQSSQFG